MEGAKYSFWLGRSTGDFGVLFVIIVGVPVSPIEDRDLEAKDFFLLTLDPPKEASSSLSLSDDESTASFRFVSPAWAATRCGRWMQSQNVSFDSTTTIAETVGTVAQTHASLG